MELVENQILNFSLEPASFFDFGPEDIFNPDNLDFLDTAEVVCKSESVTNGANDHSTDYLNSDLLPLSDECKPDIQSSTEKETSTRKSANRQKKHICKECSKGFVTKQKMLRHVWIHRKTKFSCEICPSNFESQTLLQQHRLENHFENSPFVCISCGKNFSTRQGLWEHKRLHHSQTVTQFHCEDCDKSFSSRQGFLIHRRIHTGERPYSCLFCKNRFFGDGGTLRKHLRIHTGERPHKCPLCVKDFNQKVVLREHIRWVHAATNNSKESEVPTLEPMKCLLCNLMISDREELCAHLIQHGDQIAAYYKNTPSTETEEPEQVEQKEEDKPSTMNNSKVSFELIRTNKIILRKIEESVSQEKQKFTCEKCSQQFKTRNNLQKHKKKCIPMA